uniref:Uncharacterized protein n=1 Tax=Euplotes crassus TaxID=5936 RepID=A0A7S3K790_EUPCR|mmetsp:Transcript_13331/g.13264  ORF Transcript_13331/g.13264 Transcript_13331/m.13264 type:complete len:140 (+) Transcript_13331:217-636(+)
MTPSGASRDISVERNLSMQRKRFHRRNFSRPADRTLPVIDQKPMRFSPPTELFSDPRILDEKSFQRLRQQERQKQVQKLRENNRKAGGFSAFSPIRRPRIKQNYKQIINFLFRSKTTKKDQDLIYIYTQKLKLMQAKIS